MSAGYKATDGGNPITLYRAFFAEVKRRVDPSFDEDDVDLSTMQEVLTQVWMDIKNKTIAEPTTFDGWVEALVKVFEENHRRALKIMAEPLNFKIQGGRLRADEIQMTLLCVGLNRKLFPPKGNGQMFEPGLAAQFVARILVRERSKTYSWTGEQWVDAVFKEIRRGKGPQLYV